MSIGDRKTTATSTDNEAAFLWTTPECPAYLTGINMKAYRSLTIFTALISERWCREELILSKEEAISPRIMKMHIVGLTEEGRERYRNILKLPILFDQAYLLPSPWIWFNIKDVMPWGPSVVLLNGKEGDGWEINRVCSCWQRKGEGFSLQACTLLTSLPSVPSPVASSQNRCATGMKAKAESTMRSTPALMSPTFLSL